MTIDGVPLPNTRFASFGGGSLEDPQAFHRPLITPRSEIAFIGTWLHDPTPAAPTSGDEFIGRSIFVSRGPGHLESVVSSGELIDHEGLVTPESEPSGGVVGAPVQAQFGIHFGRVPNPDPESHNAFDDAQSLEQISYNECGVLVFTVELVEQTTSGTPRDLGWGLFVYNTAEPAAAQGGSPIGPQLVMKTGVGDPGDEQFLIQGLDPLIQNAPIGGNHAFPTGISFGYGDLEGGDVALHPDGTLVFAINPDDGFLAGLLLTARLPLGALDFDGDGVLDGCDDCPQDPSRSIGPCSGGPGCTDCLLCISEEDCPFEGLLLGAGPDFDQSGLVDETDVTLMLRAMGNPGGRCDLDKDGMVGEKDLALLMKDYGKAVETK